MQSCKTQPPVQCHSVCRTQFVLSFLQDCGFFYGTWQITWICHLLAPLKWAGNRLSVQDNEYIVQIVPFFNKTTITFVAFTCFFSNLSIMGLKDVKVFMINIFYSIAYVLLVRVAKNLDTIPHTEILYDGLLCCFCCCCNECNERNILVNQ